MNLSIGSRTTTTDFICVRGGDVEGMTCQRGATEGRAAHLGDYVHCQVASSDAGTRQDAARPRGNTCGEGPCSSSLALERSAEVNTVGMCHHEPYEHLFSLLDHPSGAILQNPTSQPKRCRCASTAVPPFFGMCTRWSEGQVDSGGASNGPKMPCEPERLGIVFCRTQSHVR